MLENPGGMSERHFALQKNRLERTNHERCDHPAYERRHSAEQPHVRSQVYAVPQEEGSLTVVGGVEWLGRLCPALKAQLSNVLPDWRLAQYFQS